MRPDDWYGQDAERWTAARLDQTAFHEGVELAREEIAATVAAKAKRDAASQAQTKAPKRSGRR